MRSLGAAPSFGIGLSERIDERGSLPGGFGELPVDGRWSVRAHDLNRILPMTIIYSRGIFGTVGEADTHGQDHRACKPLHAVIAWARRSR